MPNKCTVIRDGQEQKVEALELVPGDLVRLYIGDRVPADIRIIETYDLKVCGVQDWRKGVWRSQDRTSWQQDFCVLQWLLVLLHSC